MIAGNWITQFTPVVLVMSIIAINHMITNQRADRKTAIEASRLRSALAAELHALLDIYEKNLQLIEQKADYILSTRSSVVIYKGNLGRLTMLLDDPVIEQIVGIFAQNERIEAVVAAHSNFKCGLTYQFLLAEANFDEWTKRFEQAATDIVYVCRTLESRNCTALTSKSPVGWPKAFSQLIQQTSNP